MAWLAIDENGDEYVFVYEPHREGDTWLEYCDFVQLPIGTIRKLIGKDLAWDDDPVELK